MSLPRIGAKMRANAAPAHAPAQRPATSADQDPLLLSSDDHALLLSGEDHPLSVDEPASDPIDGRCADDCIDDGCIAEECAEAEPLDPGRGDE